MYKDIVKLKDFRGNIDYYANRVKEGKEFIVFKRSQPLFKIAPLEEERWEEVVDFTKIKKSGVDIDELSAFIAVKDVAIQYTKIIKQKTA